MNDHYHRNRDKEIEERMAKEEMKPKFTKGEKVFFVALAFIVVSLIILF